MFGHQNSDDNSNVAASAPTTDAPVSSHEPTTIAPTASTPTAPTAASSSPAATPSAPSTSGGYTMTDLPTPAGATPSSPSTPPVTPAAAPASAGHDSAEAGDLVELKQAALHELSPLIGHLDQSPEEKFRTTMMMIQASDDQSMLPTALAAAKQIKDEKARAQALLDVVNEINYFTQQHDA